MNKDEKISKEFLKLVGIMRILRSPEGCSWDRKQTLPNMGKHIAGEAKEAVEAISEGDALHIKEELGDLLMTIVLSAQIAEENGTFDISDVAHDICEKLILRHPHVFGKNEANIDPEQVMELWGKIKSKEKAEKARLTHKMQEAEGFCSAIAAVVKIQSIASEVGFDWKDAISALPKIKEEIVEVEEAIKSNNIENISEEIGDLMFATLNVARLAGVDAEGCLRKAGNKFAKRFETVEKLAEANGGFEGKSLEHLDIYWNMAKDSNGKGK